MTTGMIRMLAEYEDARRLFDETEADLARLRREHEGYATDIVKGSNPEYPYEQRSFRVEGVSFAEYTKPADLKRIEKILKERRDVLAQKRLAVEEWMNEIPSRIARIIRLKYFRRMTWNEVGMQLGTLDAAAVRMEFRRFMAQLENEDV